MEGFHSLSVWNHSQRPMSREGAHPFNWGGTLLVQLGGVLLAKTRAKGPSAAPVRFCLWHTVRIDSSCAQCKYLFVVPTVNSVPPAVVPPASRVPPSRHCTLHFMFCCFVKIHTRFKCTNLEALHPPPGLWAFLPPPGPFSLFVHTSLQFTIC